MSKTNSRLDFYKKKIDEGKSKFAPDERDWKCTLNKEGKGYAVIRFLDPHIYDENPENVPWVDRWRHQFKGPNGSYYNELCLSTIGDFMDDPVNLHDAPLWKGSEKDKKLAAQRKRKREYWANIYVVRDPANPDNEGKVFRFKFGTKIFQKLDAVMNPEFEHEERMNPFHPQEGANFILAIGRVDDFPNYDKSKFETPTPLVEGIENQKKILAQCYDLNELVAKSNFKSFDELEAKYFKVIGQAPKRTTTKLSDDDDEAPARKAPPKRQEENVDDVDLDDVMNG